jgi:uncharacterized protein YceH (UPF0502 family)
MVRGPQTPGELRSRTERLHEFKSPEEFQEALAKLESYGYAVRLERQPGRKESRYGHLLCGKIPVEEKQAAREPGLSVHTEDRIAALEEKVDSMQQELQELKQAFFDFKRQLE